MFQHFLDYGCEAGYTIVDDMCYKLGSVHNWYLAVDECFKERATLLTLKTEEEFDKFKAAFDEGLWHISLMPSFGGPCASCCHVP